jgi:DNA repair exonuclease SbcCD nuclease subunit
MGAIMAKIPMIADVHLGVPGRLHDIVWSLNVVEAYCARENLDLIFGLGDLFNDRRALEIDALCAGYDYFSKARQQHDQRWIWLPGNHDMFLKHSWEINSLRPLSEVITIIETVKIIKVAGIRFWVLPFIHFESAYMRVLKKIEEQHEDGDVLLTHIGTVGAIKNVCFLLKDWSIVTFHNSPFKQVYAGHFHSTQQVGHNVWYPGSLIPFKFDEGDCPHGFFVYDTTTRTHEFIDIWQVAAELVEQGLLPYQTPPPNFYTIPEEALDELDPEVTRNNIIRVAVNQDYSTTAREEVKEKLADLGARDVRWLTLAGEPEAQPPISDSGETGGDLFEAWLEADTQAIKTQRLDLGILRSINAEVVKEGDEQYSYTSDE